MAIYLAGFGFSTLFVWISEKNQKYKVFWILAVAVLTYIAAMRGLDVGIDIKYYVLKTYKIAQTYRGNFFGYIAYNPDQVEPLYMLTEYIAANVIKNVHFALFVFSLLSNTFILLGVKNLRNRMSVTVGWIAYCLLFYSVTLNLMRQFIAIAIIFYLFSDSKKLNWKRAAFFSLLAMGFHISGLMGMFLYAVYIILGKKEVTTSLFKMIVLGLFLSLPFLADILLGLFSNLGIVSGKFLLYLNNEGDVALGNIIFRSVGMVFYAFHIFRSKLVRKDHWIRFILYTGIIDILFLLNNGLFSLRVGKMFSVFEIVYFTIGLNSFKKGKSRIIASIALTIFLFAYWYYQFVVLNSGLIYPYEFDNNML